MGWKKLRVVTDIARLVACKFRLRSLKNYAGCIDKLEAYKQHSTNADLIQEADYMLVYAAYEQWNKYSFHHSLAFIIQIYINITVYVGSKLQI